jgi:hypothetical protein
LPKEICCQGYGAEVEFAAKGHGGNLLPKATGVEQAFMPAAKLLKKSASAAEVPVRRKPNDPERSRICFIASHRVSNNLSIYPIVEHE